MTDHVADTTSVNKAEDLKNRIRAFMQERHSGVSFIEMQRAISGFDGEFSMLMGPNVIIWSNMSEEVIDALYEMRDAEEIYFWPAPLLIYLCDGGMLSLPIAKRPTKRGYKEPHWLPAVINSGPSPTKYRRKT